MYHWQKVSISEWDMTKRIKGPKMALITKRDKCFSCLLKFRVFNFLQCMMFPWDPRGCDFEHRKWKKNTQKKYEKKKKKIFVSFLS